ncbi:MAG: hypothetical protein JHC88_21845 [Niveispirillum sp.]|nr:hypothetical protein [Niveispirillum sp.]
MHTEPRSAHDYDDRTTRAVESVLVEMAQILGSYRGKFTVIGGSVPWLLLNNDDMPHVGSLDVDICLDAEALGDGEYASLVESLMGQGYAQRPENRRFQLVRQVPDPMGGPAIEIIVDFLMPRNAVVLKNDPTLIDNFAVQRADGADLALQFSTVISREAWMPGGGRNRVDIAVCSIPALLALKGYALSGRLKQKDAYDIYYCIRNYPGGVDALANDCQPVLKTENGRQGFRYIADKFGDWDSFGPTCVRQFIEETRIAADLTPDQWQTDAYEQVRVLLLRLTPFL